MTGRMKIAAVQMVSGPDIGENLREADRLVAEAAARGAKLVALPEYFPLISGNETDKVRAREKEGEGPLQDFLRGTALRHKVWLVGGSIPLEASSPHKVRNSCLVFDDAGRRAARYDKIHLFGFQRGTEQYNESQTIEAGGEVVVFDSPVGRVGLSICYDLRFPELYRAMGPVDLLVVPAAFTHTTARRTGSCCCARGRWKTFATCWPRHRAACTRAEGRPGATAWWSIPGARCWNAWPRGRAW